jgi:hypothetical protein
VRAGGSVHADEQQNARLKGGEENYGESVCGGTRMMRAGCCSRFGESAIAAEREIDVSSGAGCGSAAHPGENVLLCGAERIVCKHEVGAGEGEWSFAPLVGESDKCFGRCVG